MITVNVRHCKTGEVTGASPNNTCNQCLAGQYSFSPKNATCDSPCPDNANCTATSEMLPLCGHWQSGPQAVLIHACPNPDACQYVYKPLPVLYLHLSHSSVPVLQLHLSHSSVPVLQLHLSHNSVPVIQLHLSHSYVPVVQLHLSHSSVPALQLHLSHSSVPAYGPCQTCTSPVRTGQTSSAQH